MGAFGQFWATLWRKGDNIRGGTRYIIVMGMTGSGKTTFISNLTAQKAGVEVGHGLASSTAETRHYQVSATRGEDIYLIDTPGFDDTKRSDADILETITEELAQLRRDKKRLIGVIFLHRITDVRLTSSAVKNMTVLQKLCGPENYSRIALATTMWEKVPGGTEKEAADQRQNELVKYWKDMFGEKRSLTMYHKTNSKDSASEVVQSLRNHVPDSDIEMPFQIQKELCDLKLKLKETDAGRYVHFGLLTPEKQREMAELQKKAKDAAVGLREMELEAERGGVEETRPEGAGAHRQGQT